MYLMTECNSLQRLRRTALSLNSSSIMHHSTSISRWGALYASNTWFVGLAPVFHCGCHLRDTSWSHGSGDQRSLKSWMPQDYGSQRNHYWHCMDSGLRHTPKSFCKGGHFTCLKLPFAWGLGFRFGTHLGACIAALKENIVWSPSPSSSFQLTAISQKRTCTPIWSPDFCPRVHLQISFLCGQKGL